ncbi:hypothetical protein HYPSUDRAFT_205645 [Hypholoma sublateritium FD-334 SS-4]|uniref:Uncharacterized protein n=1 Tax=Hypholoma sublateritium (strain FD-334 SS-4) TaxID=945553 RepID=A0A0D2NGS1_HYPSF|nr:hypothetical protein HYPSUDRAFT_205645 [Hypholoma sublateritium FD-334 SS-4]
MRIPGIYPNVSRKPAGEIALLVRLWLGSYATEAAAGRRVLVLVLVLVAMIICASWAVANVEIPLRRLQAAATQCVVAGSPAHEHRATVSPGTSCSRSRIPAGAKFNGAITTKDGKSTDAGENCERPSTSMTRYAVPSVADV